MREILFFLPLSAGVKVMFWPFFMYGMQIHMLHKYSQCGLMLSVGLLFGMVASIAGCRNEPAPSSKTAGDTTSTANGDGNVNTPEGAAKNDTGDKLQGAANTPKPRLAHDLLGKQLRLYEDLTKIYRHVRGPGNYVEYESEIEQLEKKLAQVKDEFQALPPQMRQVAVRDAGKELKNLSQEYRKAKERIDTFRNLPKQTKMEKF